MRQLAKFGMFHVVQTQHREHFHRISASDAHDVEPGALHQRLYADVCEVVDVVLVQRRVAVALGEPLLQRVEFIRHDDADDAAFHHPVAQKNKLGKRVNDVF